MKTIETLMKGWTHELLADLELIVQFERKIELLTRLRDSPVSSNTGSRRALVEHIDSVIADLEHAIVQLRLHMEETDASAHKLYTERA